MFIQPFLSFLLCAGLTSALPTSGEYVQRSSHHAVDIVPRADSIVPVCQGYEASNVEQTDSTLTADLTLIGDACNWYSEDIKDLRLLVEWQTDERLHVKIYDADMNVFQVQEDILPRPKHENASPADSALQFNITEKPFSFAVIRKANNEVLFDTSGVPLVFEKQYVRLRTNLPKDPNLYGLGEHSDPFRFTTKNYHRTLLNSESPFIPHNSNLYGTHPVYFDHRGDKGTHGVFLLNSSPMNIQINQVENGTQYLEYNTIGGVLDFYFMAGSKPAEVSKQYADIVGYSAMYPYWSFGFHQCKYGYWDVNMVAEVVANYSTAGIPLEVMWTDIDHMNLRKDFTLDPERFPLQKMKEMVSTLHDRGQRYVLILDPGVNAVGNYSTYQKGHELGVFHKNADGSDNLGVQWPGAVVWPDWFAPNTQKWWTDEILSYYDAESGINLDGIWVDMNEASNFCPDENCNARQKAIDDGIPPTPQNPPRPNTGRPIPGFPSSFQPNGTGNALALHKRQSENGKMKGFPDREWFHPRYNINSHRGDISQFTILTNTTNYDGTWQYDTHNFYGHMMATATYESMLTRRPGLRPMVLTRSTFAGTGRKATHWFGDNESSWEHYRTSIRQMLAWVSMHQMPMVGSDVCGFNGNAEERMCARWALLGAFQPFYRNHAELSSIQQEFYQWPLVTKAAKKAIETRYKLIDYIYTALYYQTTDGEPMVNPLFFLYPEDTNTFGIQDQWFYGDSLLISPVVNDFSETVTFYLPEETFYDYWTHERIEGKGANITLNNISFTDIPVHIRGGSVIPHRMNSANTTKELRKEDFYLVVAPDADGNAWGRLYLDEGEKLEQEAVSEIEFKFDGKKFSCTGTFGYAGQSGESVTVDKVLVLGQDRASGNGKYNSETNSVEVKGPWKLNGQWGFEL